MNNLLFRSGATTLSLDGNLSPTFPHAGGEHFYTFPTDRPEYSITNRAVPSSVPNLNFRNLISADKATLKSWWETTLVRGTNPFTIFDHNRRVLFDVAWDRWEHTWKRQGVGTWDVPVVLSSAFPWTQKMFGCYPLVNTGPTLITDHGLKGDASLNVNTSYGILKDHATDANVLRKNGYALRLTDNDSTPPVGATGTVSFKQTGDASVSMFCQLSAPSMQANPHLYGIQITSVAGDYIRFDISQNTPTVNLVRVGWYSVGHAPYTLAMYAPINVWYDVGLSYDAVGNRVFGYICASATGNSWLSSDNYIPGSPAPYTPVGSYLWPTPNEWVGLDFLKSSIANAFVSNGDHAYIQNAMIMDGWISPREFNFLRRICHLWNNKTYGTYPQ